MGAEAGSSSGRSILGEEGGQGRMNYGMMEVSGRMVVDGKWEVGGMGEGNGSRHEGWIRRGTLGLLMSSKRR